MAMLTVASGAPALQEVAPFVLAIVSLISVAAGFYFSGRLGKISQLPEEKGIKETLEELGKTMASSRKLLERVEAELEARITTVAKLTKKPRRLNSWRR
jgi:hypothetical protein